MRTLSRIAPSTLLAFACLVAAIILISPLTATEAWASDHGDEIASGMQFRKGHDSYLSADRNYTLENGRDYSSYTCAFRTGSISDSYYYYYYTWVLYEDGFLHLTRCGDIASSYDGQRMSSRNLPTYSSTVEWSPYKDKIKTLQIDTPPDKYGYVTCAVDDSWFNDCENLATVSAGSGLVAVRKNAFKNCKSLTTVDLPNCKSIQDSAFEACASLVQINAPAAIEIRVRAFADCSSLTSLALPLAGKIGEEAFSKCERLRSITLPESFKKVNEQVQTLPVGYYNVAIAQRAFIGCHALRHLGIPEGATAIEESLCEGCTHLESVYIPGTVTSISRCAFKECSKLRSIALPASLTSIGVSAFAECNSLSSAPLPQGIKTVCGHAFSGTAIESLAIPKSLSTLDPYSFEGCKSLKTIKLPDTLTSISSNAFQNCSSLESMDLQYVRSVSSEAFSGCSSLTSVIFSKELSTLSSNVFNGCTSLLDIYFLGDYPNVDDRAFAGVSATCWCDSGNDTWNSSCLKDYGGALTWYAADPDFSSCSVDVSLHQYSYSGKFPTIAARVTNRFGIPISPDIYKLGIYRDTTCKQPIDVKAAADVGIYYIRAERAETMETTQSARIEIVPATLTAAYNGEHINPGEKPLLAIEVEGFVAGESENTAAGYIPPTLELLQPLDPGESYRLTPTGGNASNYVFEYKSGVLVVNPRTSEMPVVATGLTYDGKDCIGIAAGPNFTLSGTTHAVNAGSYTAYATPIRGYAWDDGSTGSRSFTWSIGKATLEAAFIDETVARNGTPELRVKVSGFVNGESPLTAEGYSAPTVSIPSQMMPGETYTATVVGGSAKNYSFRYINGSVTVSTTAIVAQPSIETSFVYDGSVHMPISSSSEYTLGSVSAATNAGVYEVTAEPAEGYVWSDGSRSVLKFTWRIAKAEILTPDIRDSFTFDGTIKNATREGNGYLVSGTFSAIEAGTYAFKISLLDNFAWADGSRVDKDYTWTIHKATGRIAVSEYNLSLHEGDNASVDVNWDGDGNVNVVSSAPNIATAVVSGTRLTVSALEAGSSIIELSMDESRNYTNAYPVQVYVTVVGSDVESEAAAAVTELIGKLTVDGSATHDAEAVAAARAAYDALTDAQKALVGTDALARLENAEKALAADPEKPAPEPAGPEQPDAGDGKQEQPVQGDDGKGRPAATTDLTELAGSITIAPLTYTGKALSPVVKLDGKELAYGIDYTATFKDSKSAAVSPNGLKVAGTYKASITGTGAYRGTVAKSFTVAKAKNPMALKAKAKTIRLGKAKKIAKAKSFKSVSQAAKAAGKVTYASASGKKAAKWFKIAPKTGKITAKAGTPKGSYKVKVRATAKGDANHKGATKTVTVKVRVK